ncbi:transporter substrate-binding domain-containing protein [Mesorhizobium sp.]|nr:transporter substrate-binding domain-containing protein [Mesorhizobium sp.]RWI13361.1 MAG: transporter substrate-binding domain-containing protein [Mesorhizobium sp.]RWK45078.1 MAG: transporter substrate-binding domain-containing protein [Mesorhizobium sp.]RWK88473.1 MAG: transporter substrate-binding domain-containing protein [Mesorhizobium sp.]RWK99378.1 MAG: transporter substrate-binding domain-containing protein [Mesorhizobium sp.]TIP56832.1 MAG: transporter substrate-binding domain-con
MLHTPVSAAARLALGGMIVTMLSVATPMAQAADSGLVRNGVLNVCTGGDFPPMQYYANPGDEKLVGFEVDVVDAIAKQWSGATNYVVGDFKGLLPSLGAERCDLVASGIMVTKERLKAYDAVPYFVSNVVMVTAASDSETMSPLDLSGKVLAIEAGTTYEKTAADLNVELAKAGKAPAQIQTYPSASAVIEQILVGRAAATITQDTTAAFRIKQMPGRLQVPYNYGDGETYGIYLRKGNDNREALVKAIETLQTNGEMKALLQKWNLPETATDVKHTTD